MTYYLHNNDTLRETAECLGEGLYCKPQLVAVIPVEDREQVERLADLLLEHRAAGPAIAHSGVADALREFADPKPPKPDEPTGLGAVVEDDRGDLWVRNNPRASAEWSPESAAAKGLVSPYRAWHQIPAVRILSPGYDPEATS